MYQFYRRASHDPGKHRLVAKAATLLRNNICVSIVDVVSTFDFNLYAELMSFFNDADPALGSEPSAMYAAKLTAGRGCAPNSAADATKT